jgi:anaerobic selenocysteine-containing dehydrogenase
VAFSQISCRNHARYSAPVFQPASDRPAEWEILLRLTAIALGKGANADLAALDDALLEEDVRRFAGLMTGMVMKAVAHRKGPERLLDLGLRSGPYGDNFGLKPGGLNLKKVMAAKDGIDLGPLMPRIPEVLRTPSGKIELAPQMLLDDLKRPASDLSEPVPELVVIGRRQLHTNNSWMHNLPVLAKSTHCTALINPADAKKLHLGDGDKARIRRNGRSIEVEVEYSDEMMPGVVSLPHGWGHDLADTRLEVAAKNPGANINAIIDENLRDPLSGNAVLSGVAVEMEALTPLLATAVQVR